MAVAWAFLSVVPALTLACTLMFLLCSNQECRAMTAERQQEHVPAYPTESDIDAVIAEANGNAREAIRILLHDLDVLAKDRNASVSHGYVYGRLALVRSHAR